MIIKLYTRKNPSFKQLLEYISNKGYSPKHKGFVITHNLKGNTIKQWTEQLKANEAYRKVKRTDSIYIYHEVLSWHGEDAKNITTEKMEIMTRQYLKLRNPNGMYVAVPHYDKDHFHVHICASGIEYRSGKSLRLTKTELQILKKESQQYQIEKFPELSNSVVQHGRNSGVKKSLTTDKEYQIKLRSGRETQKEKLIERLSVCYRQANSKENFFELLKEARINVYERGGKISGVHFAGKKFRLNRIGFAGDRLDELDKRKERTRDLEQTRKKQQKTIHHGISR